MYQQISCYYYNALPMSCKLHFNCHYCLSLQPSSAIALPIIASLILSIHFLFFVYLVVHIVMLTLAILICSFSQCDHTHNFFILFCVHLWISSSSSLVLLSSFHTRSILDFLHTLFSSPIPGVRLLISVVCNLCLICCWLLSLDHPQMSFVKQYWWDTF